MAGSFLANRVKFATATTGTGTITIGAAPATFYTPASVLPAVPTGAQLSLLIVDGSDAEVSIGTYNSSAGTITRSLVQSSTGALLNLSGAAVVAVTSLAADIGNPPDVQIFTSNGTWTKALNASPTATTYGVCIGGGAGGGSGRRGAAATARAGGNGGAGGGWSDLTIATSLLGATESVTVGAGGTAGASVATDDTNGAPGSAGGNSSFGAWIMANGGSAGAAAGIVNGTAPAGGIGGVIGGVGGSGNVGIATVTPARPSGVAPGGGAAGGGITTGDVLRGGSFGADAGTGSPVGAAGIAATNSNGQPGLTRSAVGDTRGSGGGGGGYPSITGPAYSGGAGGFPGGGGGGGGAVLNGNASGAGGAGGAGLCIFITQ
uniref:hypothetical protein n=1 Tax=uncultured Sphingomonas sp. TaxID=158754 RepID=UPI0035CC4E7F